MNILTPELLAYGKRHIKILTDNTNCPNNMSRNKFGVGTNFGVSYTGAGTDNWGGSFWGLYGPYVSRGAGSSSRTYFLNHFKYFIPTNVKWAWQRDNTGWGSRRHTVTIYINGVANQLWSGGIGANTSYNVDIPDGVLLGIRDLSNCRLEVYMETKNSGGYRGILQISGFQVPYRNICAIKYNNQVIKSFQALAIRDSEGINRTVGELI